MKKQCMLMLLMASAMLLQGQVVVTLLLPDPCSSDTTVYYRPLLLQDVIIYPNPTAGLLTVDFADNTKNQAVVVEIYDIIGNRLERKTAVGMDKITLDLSEMPPGIYIITLHGGRFKTHQKIIKL